MELFWFKCPTLMSDFKKAKSPQMQYLSEIDLSRTESVFKKLKVRL